MRDVQKIRKFLELFDKRTRSSGSHVCRALYNVLLKYEDCLPDIDDYFHKSFRQTDVTDNAKIDLAIWHLLHISDDFWYCYGIINKDETND